MEGMEINATSGLLSVIESINKDIFNHQEDSLSKQQPGAEDGLSKPTEAVASPTEDSRHQEESMSSHQEENQPLDGEGARHPLNTPNSRSPPVGDEQDGSLEHDDNEKSDYTPGGVKNKEPSEVEDKSIPEGWTNHQDRNGNDRMKMMREKLTTCRKKKEFHERRKRKLADRKKRSRTYRGEKVVDAKDVKAGTMQDEELVVIGADVKSLYPSLPDVEVAMICYEAILKSGIRFDGIDFQKAGKYVAMHLTKEEQALSPLSAVLPRRTAKGGVRPGVSADPRKDVTIWVSREGRIEYKFYEKPMGANIVLLARTALSDQTKLSSLTQEVVRRLLQTSRRLENSYRMDALEKLCQKMTNLHQEGHGGWVDKLFIQAEKQSTGKRSPSI
jgi:hypothetical protein